MNYTYLIGIILGMIILIPAALRLASSMLNRRLARKLATGPVGLLLKHDYHYAMDLSQLVSAGDLSPAEAGKLANDWMLRSKGRGGGFSIDLNPPPLVEDPERFY